MKVEIISVGTEILLGDTLDTNSQYLAKQIKYLGFDIHRMATVGDNEKRLFEEVSNALARADIIFTTGGTGPTSDDITKEVCAKIWNQTLELNEESKKKLEKYFGKGTDGLKRNIKQAYFPKNSIVLPNENGTADGCILRHDEKQIMILPGPPAELIPMMEKYVIPYLRKYSTDIIYSCTLKIALLGESEMHAKAQHIIQSSINPTVAPYFKKDGCLLKITAKDRDHASCIKKIEPIKAKLYEIFGDLIYTETDETREEVLFRLFEEKKVTIMTAESITGGMIASTLINVPGMSNHLKESLIVYSDQAKTQLLGVKEEILKEYTAVSLQCCEQMVKGLLQKYNTDVALATTGYAGPGENAGLVYIGIGYQGKIRVIECHFTGSRNKIRQRTMIRALDETRFLLIDAKNVSRETFLETKIE